MRRDLRLLAAIAALVWVIAAAGNSPVMALVDMGVAPVLAWVLYLSGTMASRSGTYTPRHRAMVSR